MILNTFLVEFTTVITKLKEKYVLGKRNYQGRTFHSSFIINTLSNVIEFLEVNSNYWLIVY